MEPPAVRYVATSDGYDLAYAISGSGPPLVLVPLAFSHVQLFWQADTWRRPWFQGLNQRFRLIRYDGRGQGLSTRGLRPGLSIDDLVLDLETIVDHLHLERFYLMATEMSGHIAIRYAARSPEKVAGMILSCSSIVNHIQGDGFTNVFASYNWDAFLRMLVAVNSPAEQQARSLENLKKATTQADWISRGRPLLASDVSDVVTQINSPTLVFHTRDRAQLQIEESALLAARIPNARMLVLEGTGPLGDPVQGLRAIDAFVAEGRPPTEGTPDVHREALSPREVQVLRLIARGLSNQQIADELVISVRTVERHINHIYAKIGAHNKAQATAYALSRSHLAP
jgi:pimeloyl-ACP methyl ester carboxylesterase/DNA-binding CsgD family transcriptional regulator